MDPELGLSTVSEFENRLRELQGHTPEPPLLTKESRESKALQTTYSQLSTNYATPALRGSLKLKSKESRSQIAQQDQYIDQFSQRIDKMVNHCSETDPQRHESERMAQELGVPFKKLSQFSTVAERENFVIKTLQGQVAEQLREIRDRQIRANRQAPTEEEKGLYDWLEVQSKFVSLKERLKFALVEAINDRTNTAYLTKFFSNRNSYSMAELPKYPHADTRSIIDELTNLLKIVKQKKPPSTSTSTIPEDKISLAKVTQFLNWDMQKEQQFKQRRTSAKERLSKLIGASSWNQAGSSELVHEAKKHTKSTLQRDDLLFKYQEGNMLSPQEFQYIANTSDLLNKCCDRRFIQQAVNLLDEDIVNEVELYIAENILKEYYKITKLAQNQRLKWLSQRTEQVKQQINSHSFSRPKKDEGIKRVKEKLVAMLKSIHRQKQEDARAKAKRLEFLHREHKNGNELANPYVWKFKEKMMAIVQRHRKKTKAQLSQEFLERQKLDKGTEKVLFRTATASYTATQCKRSFHPSSKLFIKNPEPPIKRKPSCSNESQMHAYKLPLKKPDPVREDFQAFYTGGPIRARPFAHKSLTKLVEPDESHIPFKGGWITPEVEVAAANKIKFAIKAYIQRKKYNEVLEHKDLIQRRSAEQKIKKYLESKAIIEYLSKGKETSQTDIGTKMSPCLAQFKKLVVRSSSKRRLHSSQDAIQDKKPLKNQSFDITKVKVPTSMQDINLKQKKLFYSLKHNSVQLVKHSGFLYNSNDVNCYDTEGNTPLFYSALSGNKEFTQFLVECGADVNMPSKGGNTALHAAFKSNSVLLIVLLLQQGANLDTTNHEGQTPIHFGHQDTLKELNMMSLVASRSVPHLNNNHIHRPSAGSNDSEILWNASGQFENPRITRSDSLGPPGRPKSYHPPSKKNK